jgi:hypothetical protein
MVNLLLIEFAKIVFFFLFIVKKFIFLSFSVRAVFVGGHRTALADGYRTLIESKKKPRFTARQNKSV